MINNVQIFHPLHSSGSYLALPPLPFFHERQKGPQARWTEQMCQDNSLSNAYDSSKCATRGVEQAEVGPHEISAGNCVKPQTRIVTSPIVVDRRLEHRKPPIGSMILVMHLEKMVQLPPGGRQSKSHTGTLLYVKSASHHDLSFETCEWINALVDKMPSDR